VDVLVDPEEPTEVLIDSFWMIWFVPILLGFLGTLFTGLGSLAYFLFGKNT
jgi:hypothetical protein